MSDEPRMKIAPQLLGIVALAAFFLSGIRSDPAPKPARMSFEEIARQLHVGMSMNEVHAMTFSAGSRCPSLAGSSYYCWSHYVDAESEYALSVYSEEKGNIFKQQSDERLVKWHLRRLHRR
ncbi:MAG TPA: hypothetical protein VMR25_23920 [Planctomycetaceae bacterium]|jgi:hypothetical protein|nr:hypothetical protein [Planctomycetaceae bacterium]